MTSRKTSSPAQASARASIQTASQRIAIIGSGLAGLTAARTLMQAGHEVTVFEKSRGPGGRLSTRHTEFGSFDHGAQYFTVRDDRFRRMMQWALNDAPDLARPWGANAVRVLDAQGHKVESALPKSEPHWVAQPGMNALPAHLAAPLLQSKRLIVNTQVSHLTKNAQQAWHLISHNPSNVQEPEKLHGPFDSVLLAIPSPQSVALLEASARRAMLSKDEQSAQILRRLDADFSSKIRAVTVAPCWTLMLAFPNAQPMRANEPVRSFGPQWSAARSTHHRIAWLARENSKPGRTNLERWTVQASAAWSVEHLEDDAERVQAKLLKAFAEITGIRAEPTHAKVHRWRYAKTVQALGQSHLWSEKLRIGVCGDWCIGHRVEDAFVSGLELALAV